MDNEISKTMEERCKQAFSELSTHFDSLTAMATQFGVSVPAVSKWKRKGIPLSRVPYFMLKYPKFGAWKGLPRA